MREELRSHIARLTARAAGRRAALAVAAALTAFLLLTSGLPWGSAVVGLLGVALWALLWPAAQPPPSPVAVARSGAGPTGQLPAPPPWSDLLDALLDPALVLDADGTVQLANRAADALLGTARGRHIAQVERAPELLAAIDRARRTGEPQGFELHATVPVERHLTGIARPVRAGGDHSSATALLVILRDRTEAESLAQMRADFVANASHELRTPLASLKGFVETLQGAAKEDPAARERFLAIMQEQAARMSRLIEDLLSLSRIEMHEHVAPTARVELGSVIAEVASGLRAIADAAGITLAVAQAPAPAIVTGDRDELVQVAQNLMQNAIRYGRRGGRVEVSLGRQGGRVALAVEDDGIGIAAEHLPRLTERFYRVSAKESRERGGTGLGLAIVKHIVNRHRGELRIQSQQGKGSTFTVLLPAADGVRH